MRALVLAALAFGTAGCCVLEAMAFPEACVQQSTGRCVDLVVDFCSEDPASPSPACGATVLEGTCVDLGYTRGCDGYAVRPDSSC